jgi:DNA polymerase-1
MTDSFALLPPQGSRHLLAIDLNDFIRRGWHGCVNDHRHEPEQAAPTALDMLARILRGRQPSHVFIAGEGLGSVRQEQFREYKANRPPKPEGLVYCESLVESSIRCADVLVHKFAGLEADDGLHGAVLAVREERLPVVIATRDKDMLQLAHAEHRVVVMNGDVVLNADGVLVKYGMPPSRIAELLALTGDTSDNIPHVKGWGPTAAKKILAAGPLEKLLGPDGYWFVPEKYRAAFRENREMIRMAYDLVKLRGDQCAHRLDLDEMAVNSLRLARELSDSADRLRRQRGDNHTY